MRWIGPSLCVAGLLAFSAGAAQLVRFHLFQAAHIDTIRLPFTTSLSLPAGNADQQGGVLGTMEIPRLHLTLPILDNDDPHSLSLSVGHIPGTSVIGSLGNAGIAGHRDTAFRPLRLIKIGDRIETHTGQSAVYLVKSIQIVEPTDTSSLRESSSPLLTLVTCYPFDYVGSAPHRFIIQAEMVP